MVGSKIKKYAASKGLAVKNGVAYGVYRGYMLTLQEGSGWKSVDFAVCMTDELKGVVQGQLGEMLTDEFKKTYRIMQVGVSTGRVCVRFFDQLGTMSKVEEVIEIICNKLSASEVPGEQYCAQCGQLIDSVSGTEAVMLQGVVYQMHSGCASSVERELDVANEEKKAGGNLFTGIIGATLGGIVGMIPWAVANYFGWFVGWFGFLIAFAAQKGYDLLKGRQTKAKGVVIIIVSILAVLLAEIAGWTVAFVLQGASVLEGILFFFYLLSSEPEVQSGVIVNVLLGLLFVVLGAWGVIRDVFSANSKKNTSLTRM